jgi:hypothetical protein
MELRRAGCQGCCKLMVAGCGVNEYHEVMHFRRSLSLMRESGARKRVGFVWLGSSIQTHSECDIGQSQFWP